MASWRDLDLLRRLTPTWPGYDGKATDERALATADNLAFVPMENGGIQIELHAGGVELELEVRPDGQVKGLLFERVGLNCAPSTSTDRGGSTS